MLPIKIKHIELAISRRRKVIRQVKQKSNIFIETASFDTGGLERVILDSALILRELGFRITIFSTGTVGLLASEAKDAGLRVLKVNKRSKLIRMLILDRPSVVLSHFSDFGYPIYGILKIPNITFIHNVYAFLDEKQKQSILKNDKYVSRYISVSKCATNYAIEKLFLNPGKIATIPNGIIVSKHIAKQENSKNKEFPLLEVVSPKDYVFLNVAAYNLHKGHYLIASALKIVLEKYPNTKIICIGSEVYKPHLDDLKAYIKKEKLDKNLFLAGHFNDVTPFYIRANCFLLPSFIEGWSIAMTEAMFYEIPMILTETGGAPEVISNKDIGILIPNEYGLASDLDLDLLNKLAYVPQKYSIVEILAAGMIDMIENEKIWHEKAKLGRQKVIQNYDFQNVVRKYIEQIELVISEGNGNEA